MKRPYPIDESPLAPKLSTDCFPPVFIVGSARSGTTLLYHTLLSSGDFAIYRTEPAVFDLLAPKFGDLGKIENLSKLLPIWFQSYQFRLAGLEQSSLKRRLLAECHNSGDFLRILMEEITIRQGAKRWAVWGPDNLLHIPDIAHSMPNALFIHLIRDGRDVALSISKEGWIRPLPWDRRRPLLVAALHWRWKVERGRQFGRQVFPRCLEIRFEDLVFRTTETLAEIGRFIGHHFDQRRILTTSIGTLSNPNSSFREAEDRRSFNPVGRWRTHLSRSEILQVESLIGPLLEELGYPLSSPWTRPSNLRMRLMNWLYPGFFDLKQWLKSGTPLGRLVSTRRLRFQDALPHS